MIKQTHSLLKQDESSMVYKILIAQWKYPGSKGEWTEQVKVDLKDLDLPTKLEDLKEISVCSFKATVRRKAKEFAFGNFLNKKATHSKLDYLFYKELCLQNYLKNEEIPVKKAQIIFSYRTRMAKFSENYPGKEGVKICPLCNNHLDLQKFSFQCSKVTENVEVRGNYSNMFSEKLESTLVNTLVNITNFREKYLDERKIATNGHGAPANLPVCSQLQYLFGNSNVNTDMIL